MKSQSPTKMRRGEGQNNTTQFLPKTTSEAKQYIWNFPHWGKQIPVKELHCMEDIKEGLYRPVK